MPVPRHRTNLRHSIPNTEPPRYSREAIGTQPSLRRHEGTQTQPTRPPPLPPPQNSTQSSNIEKHRISAIVCTIVWFLTWPFTQLFLFIQQPWNDYQKGRNMRIHIPQGEVHKPAQPGESWIYQGGEWPWRHSRVVWRDPCNCMRGIWVTEAKAEPYQDSFKDVPYGPLLERWPQRYWPPRRRDGDGDQRRFDDSPGDELMRWLHRP